MTARSLEELREVIRARSHLPPDRTERILAQRFLGLPRRLAFALERWPLASSAVLDVGCGHGHCLAHFGPGSLGVDNVAEHVDFCRALGLEALLADADEGLGACPDGAFDYAWVSDVLEHLDAPRTLLRSVNGKLALDGTLLLFVTVLPRSRVVRRVLQHARVTPFEAQAHHYQFTYETARYLLERSGFRVDSVHVPGPPASDGLARLGRSHAPRIFFEAKPSPTAQRLALEAERRNKPDQKRG